jgi:uncharacterized Tic20 family protein
MADSHAMTFGDTPSGDDKTFGLIAHLSVYVATFLGPLVVWVLFKEKSKFIAYHAMQALALQAAIWILGVIFSLVSVVTCGIGSVLYLALIPMFMVPLWGAWKAYSGEWSGYPLLAQFGK